MSMIYPGPRKFQDGEWVRTYKGVGRVVGCELGREPTHDWLVVWEEDCWINVEDEYMEHVYQVEMGDEVWPWPEDLLEQASVLDALIA